MITLRSWLGGEWEEGAGEPRTLVNPTTEEDLARTSTGGLAEKAACALLAGMPVIVKPATSTALVAPRMCEILDEKGVLPRGAVQLVCGPAGDLLSHLREALRPGDLRYAPVTGPRPRPAGEDLGTGLASSRGAQCSPSPRSTSCSWSWD